MWKDKSIRNGIIASLIASIIFIVFLNPLLKLLWSLLSDLSEKFYLVFLDSFYKNAALGHRSWLDFMIFSFSIMVLNSLVTIFIILMKDLIKKEEEKKRIMSLEGKPIERKKIIQNMIAKTTKSLNRSYSVLKFNYKFRWVFIVFLLFGSLYFILLAYTDLQLNSSFNQRINVILPYTNDYNIKILKSKWALMKNRIDYLEINLSIEKIATDNNIILPEPLIK